MVSLYSFNFLQVLKKPHLVLDYFVKKALSYFYRKTYFSLLMVKMVKENPHNILTCSLGAITYNILAKHYFYKIGFLAGAIKREAENYIFINERYPSLINFLPKTQIHRLGVFEYLKMDQYIPLKESEELHSVACILSRLREYGHKAPFELSQFKYMAQGLKLIGVLYGSLFKAKLAQKVNIVISQPWSIGPVHGDFYLANILKDAENNLKIIDLDEFSDKGLQSLDAFNFILDLNARQNKTSWPEVMAKLLKSPREVSLYELESYLDYDLKEVALLYTLNRLGYENYHYHFLSNSVREEYIFVKSLVD